MAKKPGSDLVEGYVVFMEQIEDAASSKLADAADVLHSAAMNLVRVKIPPGQVLKVAAQLERLFIDAARRALALAANPASPVFEVARKKATTLDSAAQRIRSRIKSGGKGFKKKAQPALDNLLDHGEGAEEKSEQG